MKQLSLILGLMLLLTPLSSCADDPSKAVEPSSDRLAAVTAAARSPVVFEQIAAGDGQITCGLDTDHALYCWGQDQNLPPGLAFGFFPVRVGGPLRFSQVTIGGVNICGLTSDDVAYCMTPHSAVGRTPSDPEAVRVRGGHRFRQIDGGLSQTCGIDLGNTAWCWNAGTNAEPVAVEGNRKFTEITVGHNHTCAVTPAFKAFCWGVNEDGQVGDGSSIKFRPRPRLVAGSHAFRHISAGEFYTCALTTDDQGFCWGLGRFGSLGVGGTDRHFVPAPVAGNLRFQNLSAKELHTCARTADSRPYCWGSNALGAVGDGSGQDRRRPALVAGGLHFIQIDVGTAYSCGVTEDGAGWCWGYNAFGALGDGTTTDRPTPVPVAPPN